jgi:hypothetical protein
MTVLRPEMSGVCSHGENENCIQKFDSKTLTKEAHREDVSVVDSIT